MSSEAPRPAITPRLSVIVVVFDMVREAPRTLRSLSSGYQQGVEDSDYEVIVVENGSSVPLAPETIADLGGNLRYFIFEAASTSPAAAVNFGVKQSTGEFLGILIDGARIVTPGMLRLALQCLRGFPRPVIGSLSFHLGPDVQYRSMRLGYDQLAEERLLAQINWPLDGYRLFEIGTLADSSRRGWLSLPNESNCFFLSRALYDEAGGYDEAFDLPGGGFVNLDFWSRVCGLPRTTLISLLGEASFHQTHGGAATGCSEAELTAKIEEWSRQFLRIRGKPYKPPTGRPLLVGTPHEAALPWLIRSGDADRKPLRD